MLFRLFSYPVKFFILHGYGALFVWSVLEGEIGLMLAGWLASQHIVFTYSKVIIVAICGALIGDFFTFSVGRLFEKRALAWLQQHPKKKEQVDYLLKKYGEIVIVFERFIYGTHIPVLLSLGMSGYPLWKFLFSFRPYWSYNLGCYVCLDWIPFRQRGYQPHSIGTKKHCSRSLFSCSFSYTLEKT